MDEAYHVYDSQVIQERADHAYLARKVTNAYSIGDAPSFHFNHLSYQDAPKAIPSLVDSAISTEST